MNQSSGYFIRLDGAARRRRTVAPACKPAKEHSGAAMTHRTDRVGKLIRNVLGQLLLRKISDPRIDPTSTSVTRVAVQEDLLAAKVQGEDAAVVNCDRVDEIHAQSARYPDVRRLGNAVDAIVQTKRGILGNGNAQILTEALMMRLTV